MEHVGTVFALVILAGLVGAIIFRNIRKLRRGQHICGNDCKGCSGACHCDIDSVNQSYEIVMEVDGMMCGMCEGHICNEIRTKLHVKKVKASHATGIVKVYATTAIMKEEFIQILEPLGYRITSYHLKSEESPCSLTPGLV